VNKNEHITSVQEQNTTKHTEKLLNNTGWEKGQRSAVE
jgi:hypothetical protein